jgi:hypothetical protein
MENIVKVTLVSEVKIATNERKYKTVRFVSMPKMITIGNKQVEVKSNQKEASRNIWADLENPDGTINKGDSLYNTIAVNDYVEGTIVSVNTSPYSIGERTVNSWTGVVFSNEDTIKYVNSQLKSNNAEVVVAADTTLVRTSQSTPALVEDRF